MAWGGRREGLARCGSELEWEGGGGQAPGEQAVEEQEGLGGKRASGGIRKAEVCGQGAPGGGALGDSAPEGGQTDRRHRRETRWEEGGPGRGRESQSHGVKSVSLRQTPGRPTLRTSCGGRGGKSPWKQQRGAERGRPGTVTVTQQLFLSHPHVAPPGTKPSVGTRRLAKAPQGAWAA